MKGGGPDKATRVPDGVRRATSASTPSHSTQAGARHRERAEPIIFFLSSPPSPSVTTPSPASSSSLRLHRLPRPLHLHLSHVSIEHRPPLATVALPALRQPPSPSSPAPPPSANCRPLPCVSPVEHHQSSTSASTSLSLCRRRRLLLFPFLASVAIPSPVFPSSRHHPNRLRLLLLLRLHRAPPVSLPHRPCSHFTPPPSSPLCCRIPPPLPCSPSQPPSPSTSAPLLSLLHRRRLSSSSIIVLHWCRPPPLAPTPTSSSTGDLPLLPRFPCQLPVMHSSPCVQLGDDG